MMKRIVVFVLPLLSIGLFFLAMLQVAPLVIPLDAPFGMTSVLPITYWGGLALLVTASILLVSSEMFGEQVYQSFIVLFVLYFIGPVTIEPNARIPDSYWPLGETANVILKSGFVNIGGSLSGFQSWPAFNFIMATLHLVTDFSLISIAKYWPVYWGVLFSLMAYASAKQFGCSSKVSFLVAVFALSLFWMPQTYAQPRVIALLLSSAVFLFLKDSRLTLQRTIAIGIILAAIAMTEATTSFVAVVIPLVIVGLVVRRSDLIGLGAFGGSVTTMFVVFSGTGPNILATMFNLLKIQLTGKLNTALLHTLVPITTSRLEIAYLRYYFLGLLAALILLAIISYTTVMKNALKPRTRILLVWVASLSVLAWFNYNGTPLILLIITFAVIPASLLGGLALSSSNRLGTKHVTLTILLLIFALPHMPATYATEATDQVLSSSLAVAYFYGSYGSVSLPVYTQLPALLFYYNPQFDYYGHVFSVSGFQETNLSQIDNFIMDAQPDKALKYGFGEDEPLQFITNHTLAFEKVYANQLAQVYSII
jgi:hypothetical protein